MAGMNKRQWFGLLLVYILYLLLGGGIFWYMESEHERARIREQEELRLAFIEHFVMDLPWEDENNTDVVEKLNILRRMSEETGISVVPPVIFHNSTNGDNSSLLFSESDSAPKYKWTFYNGFFFSFTIVTTIGYGHLSPVTPEGRVFCIFYALIGIPLNGILLAALGEFFAQKLVVLHHRAKGTSERYSRLSLCADVLLYLLPGFLVFIFLPAGCLVVLEGWSFIEAVYFGFITLTTIGLGDLVAGNQTADGSIWMWVYKIMVVCWIIFGLGYLLMILGYISKAYRSKKVRRMERKIRRRLRGASEKIGRVSREAKDIKRLANALNLVVVKPIYNKRRTKKLENQKLEVVTRDDTEVEVLKGRRRYSILRRRRKSDSELEDIDKTETFKDVAMPMHPNRPMRLLIKLASGLAQKDSLKEETEEEVQLEETPDQILQRNLSQILPKSMSETSMRDRSPNLARQKSARQLSRITSTAELQIEAVTRESRGRDSVDATGFSGFAKDLETDPELLHLIASHLAVSREMREEAEGSRASLLYPFQSLCDLLNPIESPESTLMAQQRPEPPRPTILPVSKPSIHTMKGMRATKTTATLKDLVEAVNLMVEADSSVAQRVEEKDDLPKIFVEDEMGNEVRPRLNWYLSNPKGRSVSTVENQAKTNRSQKMGIVATLLGWAQDEESGSSEDMHPETSHIVLPMHKPQSKLPLNRSMSEPHGPSEKRNASWRVFLASRIRPDSTPWKNKRCDTDIDLKRRNHLQP
ncbi:unnamed protein product [Darwinula stevensoni]|uniref:Potassium channel domain-containing protein n=1 Tax=Darwinula stevensoni TaxID=69355 RepID=A0A7R8X441_9CRUS|nr:unnamed protein product [Darwinula stevensoni]CAG0878659.1 unnamed protein product [Darwinula stevensoni]